MVILIAGGTGTLGRELQRRLTAGGLSVRVMTRDLASARDLVSEGVEVVAGDAGKPESLGPALDGVETVISAISGYGPQSRGDPRTVDGDGNRNLIRAAVAAGVQHFVLISMHGAAPDHPMELVRMKHAAEHELKRSGLSWTIIRPTAFLETWAELVGGSPAKGGRALILGRGENPINFVSVRDVADLVEKAIADPALRYEAIEAGGSENLTLRQLAARVGADRPTRIPRPALRLIAVLARPFNSAFSRLAHDAVLMDTRDFTFGAESDACS